MSNQSSKAISTSCIVIVTGIFCLWTNLSKKHLRYYLGEELIQMSVKIEESPKHYRRKNSETRYYFKTVEYPCEFWLSAGAHDIIKDNEFVKNRIERMVPGASVTLEIRTNDKSLLDQSSGIVRVIGLRDKTARLIQPEVVEKKDRRWFIISISFSIVLIVGGILLFFFNWKQTP